MLIKDKKGLLWEKIIFLARKYFIFTAFFFGANIFFLYWASLLSFILNSRSLPLKKTPTYIPYNT